MSSDSDTATLDYLLEDEEAMDLGQVAGPSRLWGPIPQGYSVTSGCSANATPTTSGSTAGPSGDTPSIRLTGIAPSTFTAGGTPTPRPTGGTPSTIGSGGTPSTLTSGGTPASRPTGGTPASHPTGGIPAPCPTGGTPSTGTAATTPGPRIANTSGNSSTRHHHRRNRRPPGHSHRSTEAGGPITELAINLPGESTVAGEVVMVGAQVIRGHLVIEDSPMDEEVVIEAFPQGHTHIGVEIGLCKNMQLIDLHLFVSQVSPGPYYHILHLMQLLHVILSLYWKLLFIK